MKTPEVAPAAPAARSPEAQLLAIFGLAHDRSRYKDACLLSNPCPACRNIDAAIREAERAAESRGAKAAREEALEEAAHIASSHVSMGTDDWAWKAATLIRDRIRALAQAAPGSPSVPAAQPKDQANQGAPTRGTSAPGGTLSLLTCGVCGGQTPRTRPHVLTECVAELRERLRREQDRSRGYKASRDNLSVRHGEVCRLLARALPHVERRALDYPDSNVNTAALRELIASIRECVSVRPRAAPTPALPREAPEPGGQPKREASVTGIRCPDCGGPAEIVCGSEACIQQAMAEHTAACRSLWPASDPACPACNPPAREPRAAPSDSAPATPGLGPPSAGSVLTELLRLHDWRFELAEREKNPINITGPVFRAETQRLLRQYGTEKKAAWEAARRVLDQDRAPAALAPEQKTAPAAQPWVLCDGWRWPHLRQDYCLRVEPCAPPPWVGADSDKPAAGPSSPSSASLESGGGTLDTRGAAMSSQLQPGAPLTEQWGLLKECLDWFTEEAEPGQGNAWKMRDKLRGAFASDLVAHLNAVPNPCCGEFGPCHMDAPGGPRCHCGSVSTEQSGLCGPCLATLLALASGQPAAQRPSASPLPSALPPKV